MPAGANLVRERTHAAAAHYVAMGQPDIAAIKRWQSWLTEKPSDGLSI